MSELKEYMVTTSGTEDSESLKNDLVALDTDIDGLPSRAVEIANERPINTRNTSYFLTEDEALNLKEDPRVEAVADPTLHVPHTTAYQDTNFDKTGGHTGNRSNWGLLRHIKESNVYSNSTADPGGTYDYVLDGTGVDIVIIDTGIEKNHPEFQDAGGNSRVQEINWFTASGVTGSMPAGHYTDYDGHGTHVAGTAAGKTFGWAKNAHIYSIKLDGLQGAGDPNGGISVANAMDCVLGWHNAKTNGRPTVINNSWAYGIYWSTVQNALSFSINSGPYYSITGGVYRSSSWSGNTKDTAKGHTGQLVASNTYKFGYRYSSVDADIAQLISSGIIVCNAAGNDGLKVDVDVGGTDTGNYVTASGFGNFFYHLGSSPHCGTSKGFQVGSLGTSTISTVEVRSSFSNTGPGVSIYAAGSNIISSFSNVNTPNTSYAYFNNGSYRQQSYNGTSMASPQIAGLCALLLQAHSDWTPTQVYNWMVGSSKSILYTTGQSNDYTTTTSTFGGSPNIAYFSMNGQKTFQMLG